MNISGVKYAASPTQIQAKAQQRAAQLERWQREQLETREALVAEVRASFKDYQKALRSGVLEPGSWGQQRWKKSLFGKIDRLQGKRVRVIGERTDINPLKGRDKS